ncbi:UNVERIFIED_CONTAM: hypothetical protein PYX00_011786 [Menopon gallinae]|uniref:PUM-HD domain-containing protein n=1 Tax=Menopon gallinae TaxID=328185 RepID=A0AAW2H8E6_9NEOP
MNFTTYRLPNKEKVLLLVLVALALAIRRLDLPSAYVYNIEDPLRIVNNAHIKRCTGRRLSLKEHLLLRLDIHAASPLLDLLSSVLLDDPSYFLLAVFLNNDLVSLENLLLVVRYRCPVLVPLADLMLLHLNPYYIPLLFADIRTLSLALVLQGSSALEIYEEAYRKCHLPSLNAQWLFHMNMFQQYNRYFFDIFNLSFAYFCIVSKHTVFMIFLFNQSYYKSFLFVYKLFGLQLGSFYAALIAVHAYLMFVFRLNGVANLNFVNWVCLVFNTLLCFEMYYKKKISKKRKLPRSPGARCTWSATMPFKVLLLADPFFAKKASPQENMAENLEYDNSSVAESNVSFGNIAAGHGMSSALYTDRLRISPIEGYDFKSTRPISAPPVEKMIFNDITMDEIAYTSFFRRKSRTDPRLPLPKFLIDGQGSFFYKNTELLEAAFSSFNITDKFKKSLVETIDDDYPESETSAYTGTSRTTTPIGDRGHSMSPRPTEPYPNRFLIDLIIFSKKINPFCTIEEKDLCFEMCKDQDGSRFIQKRLEMATEQEKVWFFKQIQHLAVDLSLDLFGNYIIQKFLSIGDINLPASDISRRGRGADRGIEPEMPCEKQGAAPDMHAAGERPFDFRTQILRELKGSIRRLSYDVYGCRVIQKLLEVTSFDIHSEFEGHVIDMVRDQNGNHVIQKCIESFKDIRFILKDFEENACEMAKHKYGCRAIQRLFENCGEDECSVIINRILSGVEEMIFDQYGNYVIQHILEFGRKDFKDSIFRIVIKDVYNISVHKFASNVMEKCVLVADSSQKKDLVSEFLAARGQKPMILSMCLNNFANYVVQRLIDSVDAKGKQKIRDALKPYFCELRKSVYSKQILNKIY